MSAIRSLTLTTVVSLFLIDFIQGQNIDVCQYFHLVVEKNSNGQGVTYYPAIRQIQGDRLSSFMKEHANRFHYILNNKLGIIHSQIDLSGTPEEVDSSFCHLMNKNEKFRQYVGELVPETNRSEAKELNRFTLPEMMAIASRFFYIESINELDTTLRSAICVSRHGVLDMPGAKDFSSLEGFVFEAIFEDGKSTAEENFENCKQTSLKDLKATSHSLSQILDIARQRCYAQMAEDAHLKKHLMKYYKKNRDNVSWRLE